MYSNMLIVESVQFFPLFCVFERFYTIEKVCLPTAAPAHFSIKVGPLGPLWHRPVLGKGL